MRLTKGFLFFLILAGLATGAHAAIQYWDSSAASLYQHGDGVWSTNAVDANWRANHTASAAPWANGNSALFSATTGTSFITLSSSITAVGMTMAGGGHTLVITNGGVLSSSVGVPTISGSNNNFIVTGQGSRWNFNNTSPLFGTSTATNNTLTIDQGGAVENIGMLYVFKNNSFRLLGGSLSVSNVTWYTNALFTVGDGTQAATLIARGGTLTFQNGVLVNSNSTLRGSGTNNGSAFGIVMTNGSTLTVGETNTIATLTLRDSATWYGGTTLNLNITNVAGIAGTDWDQVRILGALSVIPNGGKLKIKLDSLGETAGGFHSATSRIVNLINFTSSALNLSDIEVDTNKFLIGGGWTLEATPIDIRYVYRRPLSSVHVSPGGDNTAGTNWSTAFQTLTNAWTTVQNGDTVYMAGQTFNLTTQIVLNARDGVAILGGYEAASDAVLPGPNDPAQWPTVLQQGDSTNRVLNLSGLTNCVLKGLTIRDGFFSGNASGAGIYIADSLNLTLDSCVIISNRFLATTGVSKYGGGIYIAGGVVTITNSMIMSNHILGWPNCAAYGGGISLVGGTTTVVRTRIEGNSCFGDTTGSAPSYGGGVYLGSGAFAFMRETVIASNNATGDASAYTYGGGIHNGGWLHLENCLVAKNSARRQDYAGIYSSGNLTIMNCTVADNSGTNGYGIRYDGGTIGMTNSIVWGHLDDLFGFPNDGGVPPVVSNVFYSCIQDGDNNGVQECINSDPLFVDTTYYHLQSTLSNYVNGYFSGGSWATSLSNSPAIDKGHPGTILTGEPMPNKGIVNMGYDGNTAVASLSPTINATLPAIVNLGATEWGHRTVTLNAEVTDTGGDTPTCWFEYWITGSAVTSTASAGLQSAVFPKVVSGLTPDSAYQFRVVVSNAGGVTNSTTNAFSTHPVPSALYVATNGNNTAGTNWSTAYTDPQTVFNIAEAGDIVYLAGHTFAKGPDLNTVSVWAWSGVSNVTVIGGYQAASDAVLPGPNDAAQWPTVLKRASGNARVLHLSNITNSVLRAVTIRDGAVAANPGGGLYFLRCGGLTLDACIIATNRVTGLTYGGGIYADASVFSLTNCLIATNSAAGGGNSHGDGGGVYVKAGVMTMVMCRVEANMAIGTGNDGDEGDGGGIWMGAASTGVIVRSVFTTNRCTRYGGGICSTGSLGVVNTLVVRNNSTMNLGDGIYVGGGAAYLGNCTVADNSGFGIQVTGGAVGITNSILWGNGDDLTGTVSVAYSAIGTADDFWTNQVNGCIAENPLFVDTVYYHLQSRVGNYLGGYFSGGTGWGTSLSQSPCIDTGYPDPAKPWMGVEPDPNGGRSNMGAYGNTTVASKGVSVGTLFMLR
jgi:hypothetical protein